MANAVGVGKVDASLETSGAGDSLSIALGPLIDASNPAWILTVVAVTASDEHVFVGSVWVAPRRKTEPSAIRIVAGAWCPGVSRWEVTADAQSDRATAGVRIALAAGREPTTIVAPQSACVWSVQTDGLDLPGAPALTVSSAASVLAVSTAPCWLIEAYGTNVTGSAAYVQLHDSASPVLGDHAKDETIAQPGASWIFPIITRRYFDALSIVLSSTPDTYTPVPASASRLSSVIRPIRS